MQKSTEIRWFLDNKQQTEEINKWFFNTPFQLKFLGADKYPRQDYYLVLADVVNVGIKIREPKKIDDRFLSKIEVKVLEKDFGIIQLGSENQGVGNS